MDSQLGGNLTGDGAILVCDSVICNNAPDDDAVAECSALGAALTK